MKHGSMRRQDRVMASREEQDQLLRQARVLRLAMAVDNDAYLVPLSFGYDGQRIYFHTARNGLKLDYLRRNPRVCFEVEEEARLITHEEACEWTFAFASVIGRGVAHELVDHEERIHGLNEVMRHYGGVADWHFAPGVLSRTAVWAVEITELSGKRSPVKATPADAPEAPVREHP